MKRFGLNDFVTVKGNLGKMVGQVGAYMQPMKNYKGGRSSVGRAYHLH